MKPIAYLCFANDTHQTGEGYLHALVKERDGIREQLADAAQKDWLSIEHEPDASLDRITIFFTQADHLNRVVIFHYAGHANGDGISIRTLEDTPANNLAGAAGLADIIKNSQKNLQLVFLNGCSTKEQVQFFLDAGVPNVIATSRAINDEVAVDFALRFYDSLSNNMTIQTAFDIAKAHVKSLSGSNQEPEIRAFAFKKTATAEILATEPWNLYSATPDAANWRIGVGRLIEGSVKMFLSYAEADTNLKNKLLRHLAIPIRRSKKIEVLNEVMLGEDIEKTKQQLYESDIILLLVSNDYLAGDFADGDTDDRKDIGIDLIQIEEIAMQRRANGEAKVIPIYLSPVALDDGGMLEFARIQGLPRLPNKPRYVSQWKDDIDTVLAHIASNIMTVVNEMLALPKN